MLLAPADPPDSFGRRIAIAWNGSMQATRAVSSAMPFLTKADEVLIAAIETEKSVNLVCHFLMMVIGCSRTVMPEHLQLQDHTELQSAPSERL